MGREQAHGLRATQPEPRTRRSAVGQTDDVNDHEARVGLLSRPGLVRSPGVTGPALFLRRAAPQRTDPLGSPPRGAAAERRPSQRTIGAALSAPARFARLPGESGGLGLVELETPRRR